MTETVLDRFRCAIRTKRTTIRGLARQSGIPAATLHEMVDEGWSTKAVAHLSKLEQALDKLDDAAPKGGA